MTALKIFLPGVLFFFLMQHTGFAESPELTISKIKEKKALIQDVCRQFDVNPCYLSAIIYTERTNTVRHTSCIKR